MSTRTKATNALAICAAVLVPLSGAADANTPAPFKLNIPFQRTSGPAGAGTLHHGERLRLQRDGLGDQPRVTQHVLRHDGVRRCLHRPHRPDPGRRDADDQRSREGLPNVSPSLPAGTSRGWTVAIVNGAGTIVVGACRCFGTPAATFTLS